MSATTERPVILNLVCRGNGGSGCESVCGCVEVLGPAHRVGSRDQYEDLADGEFLLFVGAMRWVHSAGVPIAGQTQRLSASCATGAPWKKGNRHRPMEIDLPALLREARLAATSSSSNGKPRSIPLPVVARR